MRKRTPVNENHIRCCCGKKCKGLRGLKSHQRSCCTIRGLNGNLFNELQAIDCIESETLVENALSVTTQPYDNSVKKGVNLPTTQGEWELANSFFHSELPISEVNKDNLNNVTEKFNRIVYDYFHDNYRTAKKGFEKESELQVKYKDYSKSQLKKELRRLKHNNTDTDVVTIRFVAKLLRSKVNSENTNCFKDKVNSIDHDKEIKKNFWWYVKEFIKKPNQILPNFNREICTNYFSKILRTTRPLRSYVIPEWIPKFSRPIIDFRREPPSYQEIAKIIRKMKASGSPCPLDQVSVICLK